MRILWAGPVQGTWAMLRGTAPHPATMRWQRMFIAGLRDSECSVRWIGHAPHRTWPWGPMLVARSQPDQLAEIDAAARDVPYVNMSGYRNVSLRSAYRRQLIEAIERDRPDALVSYNADPWMQGVADAAAASGVPWIPIILDLRDPRADDWRAFKAATGRARGVAFVSHWAYRHAPGQRKHLVSGFVLPRRADHAAASGTCTERTILFSGTHTVATGVDRLLAAMPLLKSSNVRLVITGHGRRVFPFPDLTGKSVRIEDRGLLPAAELEALTAEATVLVNPRPIETADSCTNFPSKILDYLSYEVPIVSTRAPGIGPRYDDVLTYTASDSPEAIAATLDEVLRWDEARRTSYARRVRSFNAATTPAVAGERFATWLSAVSSNR